MSSRKHTPNHLSHDAQAMLEELLRDHSEELLGALAAMPPQPGSHVQDRLTSTDPDCQALGVIAWLEAIARA